MPGKMARSAARRPFGVPERPVSVGASRRSCGMAVKRQYSPQLGSHRENPGLWRCSFFNHSAGSVQTRKHLYCPTLQCHIQLLLHLGDA